ncbi:MAG: hypothetical protein ACOYYU_17210 [Chloroflexota bacterium]
MAAANETHTHQSLGFKTSTQFHRTKRLQMLPADFQMDFDNIPLARSKIIFIRLVNQGGTFSILDEVVKVGQRFRFQYVKAILETHPQRLKVYCNGRLIKSITFLLRTS